MTDRELVLLALDTSPALSLMERALKAVDYDVAVVHDHASLVKVLDEASPALLLVGEMFDGRNGIEIARSQLERFPTLPILLYADRDTTGIVKSVMSAGLSGYLHPPLRTDDIVEAVQRSLERARHLGDWIRREVRLTTSSLEHRARMSEKEKARLESIFSSIEDGVIVLDDARRFILINRVAREAFGLDSTDLTGRNIDDVINHTDLRALMAKYGDGVVKYYELNFDDGRVFNAQHTPIPEIGSAITMQDITYLKRLDQMKSDFVHTVSHDLRSPLTAVLGYAELVERVGPLTEQQQEFVRRIQGSVQNITALVNELLDLGRLEAGFDSRRESVQLESILAYSLGQFEPTIQKKKLQLRQDVANGLPPLRANPIRIRQMIDNLVGNAVKYTPAGGEIGIQVHAEDRQLIFEVKDSGPGIPLDEQQRIFEKFYRGSNVSELRGSGLGLSIVKSIVDSYHGRVWVESDVNEGATFIVVLPAYEPKEV
ncbi:MAG TPA: ATP-binding protein [Anaerolineales bacterium]|nr:ATP-binding protein [Anaerolineales bacterium]